MAPTANAAIIICGKTLDSVLGFLPMDGNRYTQASAGKMAKINLNMKMFRSFFVMKLAWSDQ